MCAPVAAFRGAAEDREPPNSKTQNVGRASNDDERTYRTMREGLADERSNEAQAERHTTHNSPVVD